MPKNRVNPPVLPLLVIFAALSPAYPVVAPPQKNVRQLGVEVRAAGPPAYAAVRRALKNR